MALPWLCCVIRPRSPARCSCSGQQQGNPPAVPWTTVSEQRTHSIARPIVSPDRLTSLSPQRASNNVPSGNRNQLRHRTRPSSRTDYQVPIGSSRVNGYEHVGNGTGQPLPRSPNHSTASPGIQVARGPCKGYASECSPACSVIMQWSVSGSCILNPMTNVYKTSHAAATSELTAAAHSRSPGPRHVPASDHRHVPK